MRSVELTPLQAAMLAPFAAGIYWTGYAVPLLVRVPIQLVTGLTGLIILPGLVVNSHIFTTRGERAGLAMAVISGIVVNLISVEALFVISSLWSAAVPFALWVWAIAIAVSLVGIVVRRESLALLEGQLLADIGRPTLSIIALGIVIRVTLAIVAQDCIAPDAALYADYARHIVTEGRFLSNVSNDGAVVYVGENAHFVAHQGFAFLFAVGWLLLPPTVSGPTVVLISIGCGLPVLAFTLTRLVLDAHAARWVAAVIAVHPLFVFHSAVAYGPEMTSLALIVVLAILPIGGRGAARRSQLFYAGVLVGAVDIVWFANFYLLVAVIVALLLYRTRENPIRNISLAVVFGIALLIRQSMLISILLAGASAAFLIVALARRVSAGSMNENTYALLTGLFGSLFVFRWEFFLGVANQVYGAPSVAVPLTGLSRLLATAHVLGQFSIFLVFHSTVPVLLLALYACRISNSGDWTRSAALATVVAALGTLFVYGGYTKQVLVPRYVYSDSRFFLFITLTLIVMSARYFAERSLPMVRRSPYKREQIIAAGILAVTVVGLAPGYLAYPAGLELVDIQSRYGWNDIVAQASAAAGEDAVIIVDRAREFAWLTGLRTVVLYLSEERLSSLQAGQEISLLAEQFNATHLLLDDYTLAHWGILEYALVDPLAPDEPLILFSDQLSQESAPATVRATALRVVLESSINEYGRRSRLLEFTTAEFHRTENITFLGDGWSAGNDGTLSNVSGACRLEIGEGQDYTFTVRRPGEPLILNTTSGFGILYVQEVSATVARVEIWDSDGTLLRYAERIDDQRFYIPFGDVSIGDIRVVIEGNPGAYVTIGGFSVWYWK